MRYFICLMFTVYSFISSGQVFEIDTITYHGDLDKHINLVFLSDGYTQEELPQYCKDVEVFSGELFSQEPFSNYKTYFNVFAIMVPSNESGADHPGTATDVTEPTIPIKEVDTYFDSQFDYFKIHRLLVAINYSNMNTVLARNFPSYDQAFVLVNSPHYGGSGGAIPVSSTNSSAAEVVIHELGHSFAYLSDEYYAGDTYARETLNMTQEIDSTKVKWKNWHGDNGVGIYQHCCSETAIQWYKPHENCKMRSLGKPFCSVCKEAIIERIHNLVSPIVTYEPQQKEIVVASLPMDFRVETIDPIPNTLNKKWRLNGEAIGGNINQLSIGDDMLSQESNLLILTVEDTTEYLRVNDHSSKHVEIIIWNIENLTTNTTTITDTRSRIDIYPNPTSDRLIINLNDLKLNNVKASIYNEAGVLVSTSTDLQVGEELYLEVSGLQSGIYFLYLLADNGIVFSDKMIIK